MKGLRRTHAYSHTCVRTSRGFKSWTEVGDCKHTTTIPRNRTPPSKEGKALPGPPTPPESETRAGPSRNVALSHVSGGACGPRKKNPKNKTSALVHKDEFDEAGVVPTKPLTLRLCWRARRDGVGARQTRAHGTGEASTKKLKTRSRGNTNTARTWTRVWTTMRSGTRCT